MFSSILEFANQSPGIFYGFVAIFGLCLGSFLNVVISRLPMMLKQQWQQECTEFLQIKNSTVHETPFNLARPSSLCSHCKYPLKAWQKIPLLSYVILKGKCHNCGNRISWRYPIVELLTSISIISIIFYLGINLTAIAAIIFVSTCIALAFIDVEQQLLPDIITLPLLWLGLLINTQGIFTKLQSAVWGAVIGYVVLAIIGWCFHKIRRVEGIGQGDYKLLSCCGAWFGLASLLPIVLLSSILGLVVAIILLMTKKMQRQTPIAFGPFIIIAATVILFFHQEILKLFFGS